MDGWMCESIDGQKDRWMNVLMGGCVDGLTCLWMNGTFTSGRMEE